MEIHNDGANDDDDDDNDFDDDVMMLTMTLMTTMMLLMTMTALLTIRAANWLTCLPLFLGSSGQFLSRNSRSVSLIAVGSKHHNH